MKRIIVTMLAFVIVLCSGCHATPTGRWAQQREALTTATNILSQQAETRRISDKQIVQMDIAIQSARRALEISKSYLPDGGSGFEFYMGVVSGVLDRLIQIGADGLAERPQPQPTAWLDPRRTSWTLVSN